MIEGGKLVIWTLYDDPKDFPGKILARKLVLEGEDLKPTSSICFFCTLAEARSFGDCSLGEWFERFPEDEPQIVGCWV